MFRDKITVNANYTEMTSYFKRRLGENYFKGYINEHQTQLLCHWSFLPTFRISPPIPVCQMNFGDRKNAGGKIVVHFKIVNALVIFLMIAGGSMAYAMFIEDSPIVFVIFSLAFPYLFLTFIYNHSLSNLMSDIKTIEYRHEVQSSQELR